jgi:hypothetical protein
MANLKEMSISPNIVPLSPNPDPTTESESFVTKVECLHIQKAIEHRLTKLESMNTLSILTTIATFLGVISILYKIFMG